MSDNRTLKATPRRRKEARQQGRVAASGSLVGAVSWLGLAALVSLFGSQIILATQSELTAWWASPIQTSDAEALQIVRKAIGGLSVLLVPLLLLILGTAILGRIAQVGFLWVPERVLPSAARVQPAHRLAEFWSPEKAILALRSLTVFVVLGIVLCFSIWTGKESILELLVSPNIATATIQFATQWGLQIGLCLFAIGLADYAYQLYRFEASLRMTPEELRAEIQAVQENPQIGAGRRNLQQSLRGGVPQADS